MRGNTPLFPRRGSSQEAAARRERGKRERYTHGKRKKEKTEVYWVC